MRKSAREAYQPFTLIANSDSQIQLTDEQKKIVEAIKSLHKRLQNRGTLYYFL